FLYNVRHYTRFGGICQPGAEKKKEEGLGCGRGRYSDCHFAGNVLCCIQNLHPCEGGTPMLYFNSDYTEGAHPKILEQLQETNFRQNVGYGEDEYCEKARGLIREACGAPEAGVHFLVG